MDENYNIDSEEVEKKKGKLRRMRNLAQYKDLSNDEFENVITLKALGTEASTEFEKRIKRKLEEFEQDYDLSDLKINDRDTLRALIQAHITLEDYEQFLFKIRSEGLDNDTVGQIKEFHKAMSDLRADISKLQADLNITRKVRKADQDVSLQAYIDSLKEKAKKFYESKMSYVFCECGMLLGTVWSLYPNEERNRITFVCNRKLDDGTTCGKKISVSTVELLKNRGTNNRKVMPESML